MKAPRDVTAFVHVNVVPMDSERVLGDYTVVVVGQRIDEMGPSADVDVPPGATLIDGEGGFLMPGLADMHAHLEEELDSLTLFVANGVTTVRNMWGNPRHLEWRARIDSGDLLGPTIYTTGPMTDGDPPTWEGSTIVATPDAAERELLAQKGAGYDGLKIMTNLRPDVYEALLAASEKHDFPIYGHVPTRVGFRKALQTPQRSFEHVLSIVYDLLPDDSPVRPKIIEAYERKYPPMENMKVIAKDPYRAASLERLSPLAAEAAASHAWFCPTLIATEGFQIDRASYDALRRQPYNRYVPAERLRGWETMLEHQMSEFADAEVDEHALEIDRRLVQAFHLAGARLLAGTDTHPDMPFIVPGFSLHEELQNLVDVGLSPYEALRAATVEPAGLLGRSDDFGTVKSGTRADLILVEANPLDDVANASKRVGVMVRGRWFSKEDLATQLEAIAEAASEESTTAQPGKLVRNSARRAAAARDENPTKRSGGARHREDCTDGVLRGPTFPVPATPALQ